MRINLKHKVYNLNTQKEQYNILQTSPICKDEITYMWLISTTNSYRVK